MRLKLFTSFATIFILVGILGSWTPPALASTPLPNYNNIYVKCANAEGISFDPGHNGAYYIQALASPGGGFNAVHITTDPAVSMGQVTVSPGQSGIFYVTDTGGRGYEDDVVLMLAVNGTIPDNFQVHVKASGYSWTPGSVSNTAPAVEAITYHAAALDETFTADRLIYGPQSWKPTGGDVNYPIFVGEDTGDPANSFRIMFIDTHAGILGTNYAGGSSQLINTGAVKVEYTFTNMPSYAVFNVYAWNWATTQGQGMLWTNRVLPSSGGSSPGGGSNNNPVSGYSVIGVPLPSPTPAPALTPTPTATPAPTASPTALPGGNSTVIPGASATITPASTPGANVTATPAATGNGTGVTPPAESPTPVPAGPSPTAAPTQSGHASATPASPYPLALLLFIGTAIAAVSSRRNEKK